MKKEIYANNDSLTAWCIANLPEDFFKATSHVMMEYGQVSGWAISRSSHYLPNALNEFLDADEADAFIVAFSYADPSKRIVVTQEISSPDGKNRIKIPEACNAVGVRYVNTIEMFRRLGETF